MNHWLHVQSEFKLYLSGPGLPPVNVRKNGFFLDWKDNFLRSALFYFCTYILKILEKSCSRWSFGSPVHISSLNLSGLIWIIRIFLHFALIECFGAGLKVSYFEMSFWCLQFSQIQTKTIRLKVPLHSSKVEFFRSIFGRIEDTYQKDISKLTDL